MEATVEFDASKALLIRPFGGNKDIRYYLNGILVQPCEQGGVILVATDGHRLVAVRDESGRTDREIILRFEIPKTAAKQPSRAFLEGDKLVIRQRAQEVYIQPGKAEIEGKYPDWLKVVPDLSALQPGLPGEYNSRYLRDFLDLANGHHEGVKFFHPTCDEPEKAVIVCRFSQKDEMVGLLMPMRDSRLSQMPAWIQKKAA